MGSNKYLPSTHVCLWKIIIGPQPARTGKTIAIKCAGPEHGHLLYQYGHCGNIKWTEPPLPSGWIHPISPSDGPTKTHKV